MSECITATIKEFCAMSGLSRDTVYRMFKDGRLDCLKVGTRTLVVIDSYRRFIEAQLCPPVSPTVASCGDADGGTNGGKVTERVS